MDLAAQRTKDGVDIVDVIIKESSPNGSLVIFFPKVVCKFGMMYGYAFSDMKHREYYMAEYEAMPFSDHQVLAICLYRATAPRKDGVEYRVVKKDCPMFQKCRWDGVGYIELLCGERTSKSGKVRSFFAARPSIYSQEWFDDTKEAKWSLL